MPRVRKCGKGQSAVNYLTCFVTELNETNIDEMFSPRNEGELKELTERLHSYIAKMRDLRNGAPQLDSHNFFKVI